MSQPSTTTFASNRASRVEQLQAALRHLAPLDSSPRFSWNQRQREIWDRLLAEGPAQFLTWSIVHECLFCGDTPAIEQELAQLRRRRDWARWEIALLDPGIGEPAYSTLLPGSTGNLIHQAYHLLQWERVTGRRVGDLRYIVEIGGGYGQMAFLAHRLGFRGRYVIYDLPVLSLLQWWYLAEAGVDNALTFSGTIQIVPPYPDLLIANYSLSEMPVGERDRILATVTPGSYLITYQDEFYNVDNWTYFQRIQKCYDAVYWNEWPVEHYRGHRYLIGEYYGYHRTRLPATITAGKGERGLASGGIRL